MVVCLDSGDYVQIRNALIVLIRVLPHFPVLAKLAQIIEKKIDKVYFIIILFLTFRYKHSLQTLIIFGEVLYLLQNIVTV